MIPIIFRPIIRVLIFVMITFVCYSTYEYILNLLLGTDDNIAPASKRKHTMLDPIQDLTTCEYKVRRWKLFRVLHGTSDKKSLRNCDFYVVLLEANRIKIKTNDVEYPFHQDTDLFYLTGLDIPNAVAVFEYKLNDGISRPSHELFITSGKIKYILFSVYNGQKRDRLKRETKIKMQHPSKSQPEKIFPLKELNDIFKVRYANNTVCIWVKKEKATKEEIQGGNLDIEEVLNIHNGNIRTDLDLNTVRMIELNGSTPVNKIKKDDTITTGKSGDLITRNSLDNLNTPQYDFLDVGYNIQMLRLIKSSDEIILLRESTKRTVSAFNEVMRTTKPGNFAYRISAKLEYLCKIHGAEFTSFTPVISSGTQQSQNPHSTIDDNHVIKAGDLILLDAGCEFKGYVSDVTRTWPVIGKFTASQKELYGIVLSTLKRCVGSIRVGYTTLEKLNTLMLTLLAKGLQNIDLVFKNLTEAEPLKNAAKKFCPHYVGHYIGLDVHDTPLIHSELQLQPGMVITVEPGIYVPHDSDIHEKYRGMKIRIEDMVVITDGDPLVITRDIPKEIKELEKL